MESAFPAVRIQANYSWKGLHLTICPAVLLVRSPEIKARVRPASAEQDAKEAVRRHRADAKVSAFYELSSREIVREPHR